MTKHFPEPSINEVHERRYFFDISALDIQNMITEACLKVAGLDEAPDGFSITAAIGPASVTFTVPLDAPEVWHKGEPTAPIPKEAASTGAERASEPSLSRNSTGCATRVAPTKVAPSAARTSALCGPDGSPRSPKWFGLTPAERRVVIHIEGLPSDFTTAEDARMVEMLASGMGSADVAVQLGRPLADVRDRFRSFVLPDMRDPRGRPTIEAQALISTALAYLVEERA